MGLKDISNFHMTSELQVVEEQPTEQNEKNTDEVWMSKSGVSKVGWCFLLQKHSYL